MLSRGPLLSISTSPYLSRNRSPSYWPAWHSFDASDIVVVHPSGLGALGRVKAADVYTTRPDDVTGLGMHLVLLVCCMDMIANCTRHEKRVYKSKRETPSSRLSTFWSTIKVGDRFRRDSSGTRQKCPEHHCCHWLLQTEASAEYECIRCSITALHFHRFSFPQSLSRPELRTFRYEVSLALRVGRAT